MSASQALNFTIPGRPRAVQSVRFARIGGFVRKYQPQDVLDWKRYVSFEVRRQLPPGFCPFEGVPVSLRVCYIYAPPKSWPKRNARALAAGCRFWKTTKPDLSDNLNKGLVDALTGVLWRDDALVASVSAVKVYGTGMERTVLAVEPLVQGAAPGEPPQRFNTGEG